MPGAFSRGPVLPTEENVGNLPNLQPPDEEAQVRVPDYTRIGNIGRGVEGLGQGISEVGAAAEDVQKQADLIDVLKADAVKKAATYGLVRSFDTDNDYATFGQRFDAGASTINGAAADLIANPARKQRFLAEASDLDASTKNEVMSRGIALQKQDQLGTLVGSLDSNQRIYTDPAAKTTYDAVHDMDQLPPDELQQRVSALEPQAGTPGYARAQKVFADVFNAANGVVKARLDDPALSVRYLPEVKQAYDAAAQNPQAMPAAVTASLRAQAGVGIPDNDQRALTSNEAQAIVGKLTAPQEDPKAALDAAQAQFGPAWPKAFRDLATLGKLPVSYQAISALDDPNDAKMLARWINEVPPGKGPTDLIGNVGVKAIKEVTNGSQAVQDYAYSLSRSGASAGQVDGVKEAIMQLAYAKAAFNKVPFSDAADQAIKAFTGKYDYDMPGNPRVPTAVAGTVSDNAAMVLDAIDENNIAVPPVIDGKEGRPTPSDYVSLLKASPTWITSPQSDAIWLKDNQDRIVRHTNGNPVSIPFSSPPLPPSHISPATLLLTQPPETAPPKPVPNPVRAIFGT